MPDKQNNTTTQSIVLRTNQDVSSNVVVTAKQYDTKSRFIIADIRDEEGRIQITGVPQLNAIKPDGTRCYIPGEVMEDGRVRIGLRTQLLSVVGKVECDISIVDTGVPSEATLTGDGASTVLTLRDWMSAVDSVEIDGVPETGYEYDFDSAEITFENPPAEGAVISLSGRGIVLLTTSSFSLDVVKSIYASGAIESEDDYAFITLSIAKVQELAGEVAEMHNELLKYTFAPQKIADFLYYLEYNVLDYENAIPYLKDRYSPAMAGCSSVRYGNFYGRNYDWTYDDGASFIIKRNAAGGKYASVGVAGGLISDSEANSGEYSDMYKYLPFVTLDGINENGVFCNINILPSDDRKSVTTGTNPGKQDVPMACLVRCILDDAASADDAIRLITNEYNVIAPSSDVVNSEMHFMIGDGTKTYVVEFIDNAPVIIDSFVGDKAIMTNFYLYDFDGTRDSLTPHAMGIERYDILSAGISVVSSAEDMAELMDKVRYTRAYSETESPVWYSEFSGVTERFGDLTKDSTPEEYADILAYVRNLYASRERNGATWQTVHSSVYDIQNKSMSVIAQESGVEYSFSIRLPGVQYHDETKQDVIDDIEQIRSGAELGRTAYQKPDGGIPASDIANGVIPTALSELSQDANHRTVTDAEKELWNAGGGGSADLPETTSLLKGDGSGGAEAAIAGEDYVSPDDVPTVVEAVSASSTNQQIPSAKAVYDAVELKQDKIVVVDYALNEADTIDLEDNTEYYFDGTECDSVDFVFPSGRFQCFIQLNTKANYGTTVFFPADTSYIGSEPQFGAGETWEISIKNRVVVASKIGNVHQNEDDE